MVSFLTLEVLDGNDTLLLQASSLGNSSIGGLSEGNILRLLSESLEGLVVSTLQPSYQMGQPEELALYPQMGFSRGPGSDKLQAQQHLTSSLSK